MDANHLSLEALEAALRQAEPNVLLVPPWLLQRVISHDLGLLPTGLKVPDEQLYVIDQAKLIGFIEDQELPLPQAMPTTSRVFLFERPDSDWLACTPAEQALLRYWRLLTRAMAEEKARASIATEAAANGGFRSAVERRISRIGPPAFNEIRHVLSREHRLGAAASDLDVYAKFAAALTELRYFAPRVLTHVLPSLTEPDLAASVVAADVGDDLVASARPGGAIEIVGDAYQPMEPPFPQQAWWARARDRFWPRGSGGRDGSEIRRLGKGDRERALAASERAAKVGNHVRAAIYKARAYRDDGDDYRIAPGQAQRELDRLCERLRSALGFDAARTNEWREGLRSLLGPASVGWWSTEGRLLYDLQKVCIDYEREIYSVNVVEWMLELRRRPLFRPLPNQRLSLAARHLASAQHRLARCRLTAMQRSRLSALLDEAAEAADHQLRRALAAPIAGAFTSAGLVPANTAEMVSRDKMVQEILDAVVSSGYATFANVRDTISRNELRCKDLGRVSEWLGYDQLMKVDRRMADALDGVYRRGEIYRYGFQKVSSLSFGWPVGRVLTKTLVLPVLGSYLLLEAVQHTVGLLLAKVFDKHMHLLPAWGIPEHIKGPEHEPFDPQHLYTHPRMFIPWVTLALLLFALVNSPGFRRAFGRGVAMFFRGLGFLLFQLPARLLNNPLVQAVVTSRPVRLTFRYAIKPLAIVWVTWVLLPRRIPPLVDGVICGAVFMLVNLVLNSPAGRATEQAILHALRVGGIRFTADMLVHGLRETVRFFERFVEAIDRMLYAVDEWLRFRGGQARRSLIGKAMLGVVWFYIAYVARFMINLLIEPQINPIKHFPVVTVSHKLLLPMIPSFGNALAALNIFSSAGEARALAGVIITGMPGIFGFLAWELKENWKLYRANLPASLRPVQFGSHGESLAQLLRPGFHSGTLPKAYARVRRAHRNFDFAQERTDPTEFPLGVRKQLIAVHHVEEMLERFVNRAFLALLNRHVLFRSTPVELTHIEVGATRVALEFACPAFHDSSPMRVEFDQIWGWIVAEITEAGWSADLVGERAGVLSFAMRGFFKMAAVDILRSQVDQAFAPRAVLWDLRPKHLLVRPADEPEAEVEYALYERELRPRSVSSTSPRRPLPTLPPQAILFSEQNIAWSDWVAAWGDEVESVEAAPADPVSARMPPAAVAG